MDRVNRRQTACLDTQLEAVVNIRRLEGRRFMKHVGVVEKLLASLLR